MVARRDRALILSLVAGGALARCTVDDRAVGVAAMNTAGGGPTAVDGRLLPTPPGSAGAPSGEGGAAGASTDRATPGGAGASQTGAVDTSDASTAGANTAGAGDAGVASSGSGTGVTAAGGAAGAGATGAAPCRGCVELVVPVTGPDQKATFRIPFAAPGADFSAGTVLWRVQVPVANANEGFFVSLDVLNGLAHSYAGIFEDRQLLTTDNFPSGEWVDLSVNVSAHPPEDALGFDSAAVESLGLALGATATFAGAGTIRVLLDSVTITGVNNVQGASFTVEAAPLLLDAYGVPAGTGAPLHHP